MDVLDAKSFTQAVERLKLRLRPTPEQIRGGASVLLDPAGDAELRRLASTLPDLQNMLGEWERSDRPLTQQDLSVMRQAYQLWLRFSNQVYERALQRQA